MTKLREQNKIAEMETLSDYDHAANNLHSASICIRAAGRTTDEMARYKWLRLAQAKTSTAQFYLDDLQEIGK